MSETGSSHLRQDSPSSMPLERWGSGGAGQFTTIASLGLQMPITSRGIDVLCLDPERKLP